MSNTTKTLKIIRIKEVTSRTGLSKSYIYALTKEGKFPKSIRLIKGGAAVGWLESSINDWISDCIANQ
jgi:prophage regulatory protein